MKRCPECRRDYYDDTLLYCLDDGNALLEGPASSDEPATAILDTTAPANEPVTRAQIHATNETEILPAATAPRTPSSAEYLVGEFRNNKRGIAIGLLAILLAAAGFGYWFFKTRSTSGESNPVGSIAVMPFQNKGGDADTDYLSDGLAESLIFRLSQLPGLKVSPVSSVIRYKGKETDVAEVAKELEVDAVMSGRLVQRGENLMISVELVDARSKKLLWGEQYDRKMADLLATQREIASTIADKLQLKLAGNDAVGITKKYTNSNDAYQLYLKGRYHFARRTKDDIQKSIQYFQDAIKLDPNFARAYAAIAESYAVLPSYPYMSPKEAMPQAKAAVVKALEIDPDLPEAHTVAGMIAATYDWDWAKAESEFKRSLELDPNLAVTHYRYAWVYLSPMGRHDEAITEMKRAMDLEPLSIPQGGNYAAVLMYARRYDEALDQARKTYALDKVNPTANNWICHTLNSKGLYEESLAISEPTLGSGVNELWNAASLSYARMGRKREADAIIERWRNAEKTRYMGNYWIAITLAAIGNKDGAFAELEKAYEAHDWFLQRIKVDPFLDPLRDDPRLATIVKRLNLPG